ncbi:MAG: hypothetical protein FIB02_08625 [Desulfuromonas sp.]|nr:hypothetical protein [Desulfuromonas sp.]
MVRTTLILAFFVTGLCSIATNNAAAFEQPQLTDLLFPESKTWMDIGSLPALDKETYSRDNWLYRKYYIENKTTEAEDADCSTINRLLYENDSLRGFRTYDLNSDGIKDIIYTGGAECREGDLTLVWVSNGSRGFNIIHHQYALLKINIKGTVEDNVVSVAIGCCADPVDEYYLGTLLYPRSKQACRVNKSLELPMGLVAANRLYKAEKELVLRLSPKVDDEYNRDFSEFANRAVFGNIEAKYLPGAEGTIIATYIDVGGKNWGLIAVSKNSMPLLTHSPNDTNVGWAMLK